MLEQGSTVQYVATDHLGSPRALFSASGALVRELRYDAFGRRTYDSAPGTTMPLGFAGGLHDDTTGLIRLGVRDYEPASGRWTVRDPALFAAQRLNLYAYVGNDPLSLLDPLGLFAVELGFFAGVGGGIKAAFTDEGWSLCAEGGFGLGETIGISDAGLDDTGYSVTGEIGVDCFLGGITGGLDITAPCGDLEFNPKLEASILGQKWEFKPGTDEVKAQKAGTPEFDEAGKLKCGMGGKLVFKGCGQFSY
jgi:RHS repeat-associated protein